MYLNLEKTNKMNGFKRIKVFSFAKFQALLIGLLGLITGILYSFGGVFYDIIATGSVNTGTALAFFALIGMPVIFLAFGFFLGLIEAIVFNLVSRWLGPFKMNLQFFS